MKPIISSGAMFYVLNLFHYYAFNKRQPKSNTKFQSFILQNTHKEMRDLFSVVRVKQPDHVERKPMSYFRTMKQ